MILELNHKGSTRAVFEIDVGVWGLGFLLNFDVLGLDMTLGPFHLMLFFD